MGVILVPAQHHLNSLPKLGKQAMLGSLPHQGGDQNSVSQTNSAARTQTCDLGSASWMQQCEICTEA